MTIPALFALICLGAALWWRVSILSKQNIELRAEVTRLRSQLRTLRM